MSPRNTGITLLAYAVLAALFRGLALSVPVFKVPFLGGAWLGWTLLPLLALTGGWLLWRGQTQWHWSPLTLKQFRRFRDIKRGHASFLILLGLVGIASLDTLIVGKRALVVSYEDKLYFPFVTDVKPATTFGLKDESETDYRELQRQFRESQSGNWVLMPIVPYDAKLDTPETIEEVVIRDGLTYRASESKPFDGRAYTVFRDKPGQKRQEWVFRHGVKQGDMMGWDADNELVEKAKFEKGERISYSDFTDGKAAALESQAGDQLFTVVYPPSPPSWAHRHFLGTTSMGGDVLAILFGGWQQAIIASMLFVTFVFVVGVAAGGMLGYFIAYAVGGYLMYAVLFAAIGAFCETPRDAQTLMGPIMMVLTVPILVMVLAAQTPDSPVVQILSWIPFFTPFLMSARAPSEPPMIEVVGTMAGMFAFALLMVWIAGRAFRAGALSDVKLSWRGFAGAIRGGGK